MEFLSEDWSQEESWKMVDGGMNDTEHPHQIDLPHLAACIKLKTPPSCQQSYASRYSVLYY